MSNVIPFKEIFRYSVASEAFFKNVIGNILLYMPFGLFVSAHLNNKKIFPTLFLTIIASLTVETVQLVIGRVFDVDDIILNVVGGTLGAYVFIILDKFRGRLPRILKQEWFMNLIVIILLLIGILYFTNLSSYIYEMVK
jgi:glycopeptide antibiotics resistance protein